jgi:hypothetical protein
VRHCEEPQNQRPSLMLTRSTRCLDRVFIGNPLDATNVRSVPTFRSIGAQFSPRGTYLVTFERFKPATADGQAGATPAENLIVWRVDTLQPVLRVAHRNNDYWRLQWNDDESICARLSGNNVCCVCAGVCCVCDGVCVCVCNGVCVCDGGCVCVCVIVCVCVGV